ncbi:MAG: AraC family transcriptional regulator [Clostridia bacterium]|nr:AraC family transcriptional regulator [Clostridia bacterium]
MKKGKHTQSSMKHLKEEDFEFFHYKDEVSRYFEFKNHDVYEIFFLISGKVTYLIEGKSYKMKTGDILLINSSELHKPVLESGEIYERIIIWIRPDFLYRHSSEKCDLTLCFNLALDNKHNLIRLNPEMLRTVRNAIVLLEQSCGTSEFGSHILKNAYLMEIIVYLNRYFISSASNGIELDISYNEKVDRLLSYINGSLSEKLTLDNLSARFFLNKYYLLHEFKKFTGYSLHQYILRKRLILAKSLLKEGKQINEVCEECGFGDYSNFIRAFSKAFGVSPKKYYKTDIH